MLTSNATLDPRDMVLASEEDVNAIFEALEASGAGGVSGKRTGQGSQDRPAHPQTPLWEAGLQDGRVLL